MVSDTGSKINFFAISQLLAINKIRYFLVIGVLVLVMSSPSIAQRDTAMITMVDATTSRLFAAPTARSLPEDRGYVNLAEIIMPNFGYGVTDEFMIRGGLIPYLISNHVLYFAAGSLQVMEYKDLTVSGGVILTDMTGYARNWESALYGYGIASFGNDIVAIHAGFGGGYSGSRESSSAVFMIGGEWKFARTTELLSENWIISETGVGAYSLGLRIIGRSLSGELGGVIITQAHSLKIESFVPWIAVTFIL